ncbi:SAM-dependent DNA methyltransferase [Moraxella osloensis]|nr:class I SAM-dependent DNA methyltransferase [Moraxella osloensis]MBW4018571.1 SAM-dependent DNA methyltransferase [Moraxella osloensis]
MNKTFTPNQNDTVLASFIWGIANKLRGPFTHTDFGKIILPFTVLRRLECQLEATKPAVLAMAKNIAGKNLDEKALLTSASQNPFYNKSEYSLATLGGTKTRANLEDYIQNFSDNVRVIFEQFEFDTIITKLEKSKLLLEVCESFAGIDLHPNVVPDRTMSNVYEHLIARFGAEVGTESEDFMTPRDVVHLVATLLLAPDTELFEQQQGGLIRTIYDQTCGTAGFLTDIMNYAGSYKDRYGVAPTLIPFGQEIKPETHAVALGSMLLKKLATDPNRDLSANIKLGSTLSEDHFAGQRFHYQCSNPPFGMKWDNDAKAVEREYKEKGLQGRFGAGLPAVSDGSMLFLQNLASKLELPSNGGGRGAIVLSGSPLFNGGAGSGPSEIRRHLLENDLVEAIIALPTDIFFRTGIGTYIWLLSNRKPTERQGKVQLIDATKMGSPMRKNEGNKRVQIDQNAIDEITRIYADFEPSEVSKIFDYTEFGYRQIKVNRPLRMDMVINADNMANFYASKEFAKLKEADKTALQAVISKFSDKTVAYGEFFDEVKQAIKKPAKSLVNLLNAHFGVVNPAVEPVVVDGEVVMDKNLADTENVALNDDIERYMQAEVLPHAPDAVVDDSFVDEKDGKVGKVGYEINFNRYFYQFEKPRHPNEVMVEIKLLSAEVASLLNSI